MYRQLFKRKRIMQRLHNIDISICKGCIKRKKLLATIIDFKYLVLKLVLRMEVDVDVLSEVIYNELTGEVLHERKRFIDSLFNEHGYLFFCKARQSRVFNEFDYPATLTNAEGWLFTRFVRKYIRKDNLLLKRRGKMSSPLTFLDIAKEYSLSENHVRRYFAVYIKLGMIKEYTVASSKLFCKYYVVNPLYMMVGKRLSLQLFLLFKAELKDFLTGYALRKFYEEEKELNLICIKKKRNYVIDKRRKK